MPTDFTRRDALKLGVALPTLGALAGCGTAVPVPPPPAAPETDAAKAFAFKLHQAIGKTPGGVFASPYSVRVALAMTAAGANGATLAEMQAVLGLPADAAKADAELGGLVAAVAGSGAERKFTLSTANALWCQAGYPFAAAYKKRVEASYRAGLFDVDFTGATEAGRLRINQWVAAETRDKIPELLARGVLTIDTRLVLTNAIYFKGTWETPFQSALTKPAPFTLADGGKKEVPLMTRGGEFAISDREADAFQALELGYAGGEVSMLVVLPRKPDGLAAIEKGLTPAFWGEVTKAVRPTENATVFLPKFRAETAFSLGDALKEMGMPTAFSTRADFGAMTDSRERLMISRVIHKAFVEVDEKGTEAAAATGVEMVAAAARVPAKPTLFRADRPFLYAIRHKPTGAVLFLGRYAGPG